MGLLVWMSAQFCTKSGLVWFDGSTATVVDLNIGPEPGALRRGEERKRKENERKKKRGEEKRIQGEKDKRLEEMRDKGKEERKG